ncbi:hypothetical protein [Variovorax sp. LT1R16]|uniref:hypothetical protein n=1 Tax=Variovorax sp. LT1R16 TaxID=3443728 RepID=UPI003F45B61B
MNLKKVASPTALPWLVAAAFFMEKLDGRVIVTALPQMAKSFGVRRPLARPG